MERAFGRKASGLPHSLAEKPSAEADGVFTAYALDCDVPDLYRPPSAPTANELLAQMSPEARETAMGVLYNLSKLRIG